MTLEVEKILDETGWRLLHELQQNARLSYTELGQRVGLSLPSVAERVRKMEEAGIITGYHAEVNLTTLGLPILSIIRLGSFVGESCGRVAAQASEIPEVLECYKVTGTDCVFVKVVAASMPHLEQVIEQLSRFSIASTSIVFSTPMKNRAITHELLKRAEATQENLL
ncbi:AsnC family transcriptional regulator [Ktedonobacter sp. SOSP1-52]|uniref:Lrp/AsnC family transcriptional regulator n=1 Tax=Ktedonobacter sp. SOSP1-52 TaxID=2778366 RepID=UPI001915EA30|nr:Lrp/AsnC family transcriptional regulator [Ktedonobacter sp. SOSP1-52]GHO64209.1 AsnC family transcriptional regulator [Ktedonobacter sp. SOSP1-52]